jgi:RHS repeat-associated protein
MPVFNPPGGPPGPPVQFGPAQTNDSVNGGYGYSGTGTFEEDRYFYHHDHLGSSSYLTNQLGNITQHVEYIPFGEVFVEEKNDKWNTPYLFNGKELDEETGLYYYGARYYDSKINIWLSVDPLAEDYPEWSSYAYAFNNPVNLIDPTGMEPEDIIIKGKNNSSVTLTTDLIDISVDASSLGVDFGGNYTLQGEDVLSAGLDIVGIVDPTGIADGLNAGLQAKNGDWFGAGISVLGVIPYVGDVAKVGKIGKDVKIIEKAIDAVKNGEKTMTTSRAARREVMRKEGIPTSQQPKSQSRNASGREYSYDVPKKGGGTQTKSVQQQTKDRSHQGQPHWEAGKVKTDDHGNTQKNRYNRSKLANPKSKVNY